MSDFSVSVSRCRRSDERPTSSGLSARGSSELISYSLFPELARCERRAVRHGLEFGEHNVRIHGCLPDPGSEAAVTARDNVFAPNEAGIAGNALRDQFRMLDEIRFRLDHAGYKHLAVRQFHALKQSPFVRMARVGGLERDRHGFCRKDEVDDVRERHVAMMRAL